jgi:hypothetical protein
VLHALPDPDDVAEVRRVIQHCVTAAAVEAGEEDPPPPTPEPETAKEAEAAGGEAAAAVLPAAEAPAAEPQAGVEDDYLAMIDQAMAEGAAAAEAGPAGLEADAVAAGDAPGAAADVDMPDA